MLNQERIEQIKAYRTPDYNAMSSAQLQALIEQIEELLRSQPDNSALLKKREIISRHSDNRQIMKLINQGLCIGILALIISIFGIILVTVILDISYPKKIVFIVLLGIVTLWNAVCLFRSCRSRCVFIEQMANEVQQD